MEETATAAPLMRQQLLEEVECGASRQDAKRASSITRKLRSGSQRITAEERKFLRAYKRGVRRRAKARSRRGARWRTPGFKRHYLLAWKNKNRLRARENERRGQQRRRARVLEMYGHRCACCGEDRREFLALDHIAGGGEKERRAGIKSYTDALKHPEKYRCLCHNCNQSLGAYGYCPHNNV